MFIHTVLLKFNSMADDAFYLAVRDHCEKILSESEGLHELYFGRNESDRSQGLDHTIIGRFATSAAHDNYQVSAAHQSMKVYMATYIEKIVVVDAEIGERTVSTPA